MQNTLSLVKDVRGCMTRFDPLTPEIVADQTEDGLTYDELRTPAWWCRHSAGHGALIPASWCTLSAEDGAPVPFPVVHGGRRRWCTAAMLGLSL